MCTPWQEDFDEVMKTYPESFKAMDLVAEHRLRALRKSAAWQLRQQLPDDSPHLGDKIEQVLQVALLPLGGTVQAEALQRAQPR